MRLKRSAQSPRWLAALSGCLLLAAMLSAVALAQSGRRQPPPQPVPDVPTPTPEPARAKPTPPPLVRVLVTASSGLSVQLSSLDAQVMADAFMQRLHSSPSLKVEAADRMGRDAARKRAKAEEGRYVVWIELQPNGLDVNAIGVPRPNAEDLHVQYLIYTPGTGATKASGNVYLRPVRTTLPGTRGRLDCYPNRYYGLDAALMIGGIETAERVLQELSLPIPPLCGQ